MNGISQKIKGVLIVVVMFLLSVALRLQFLNSHLSDAHENSLAHMLVVLENYQSYPLREHMFRLVGTYPGEINKGVFQYSTMREMDSEGVGYYVSYPPFSAIFAWIIHSLLSLEPSILSLQILNLTLHGISSLLLFLTTYNLARKGNKQIAGLVAAAIYIFSSGSLWFLSTIYSWDTFWIYPLILLSYLLSIVMKAKKARLVHFLLLGFVLCVLILSELQGLFAAMGVICGALYFKPRLWKELAWTIICSTLIALVIFGLHTSLTMSPSEFIELIRTKLLYEYGTFGPTDTKILLFSWEQAQMIGSLIIPSIVLLIGTKLLLGANNLLLGKPQLLILMTLAAPPFIHTIFMLPDAVSHEFSVVPMILAVAVLVGMSINNRNNIPSKEKRESKIILLMCPLFIIVSAAIYYKTYSYAVGETDEDRRYYELAKTVKNNLKEDEVLFFINDYLVPPMFTYYAKRNHVEVKSAKEAAEQLIMLKKEKGKIFVLRGNSYLDSVYEISIASH